MAAWALIAAGYGLTLTLAALAMPLRRRAEAAALSAGYALAAAALGSLPAMFWFALFAPAVLLLTGYWLSGFFFRDPQPAIERALLAADDRLFRTLRLDCWLAHAPRWSLELLEASYLAVHFVVAMAAIVAASGGVVAIAHFWSTVLLSTLACYACLPWIRTRPPRALESTPSTRAEGRLRRLNVAILDRASVQANTVPSGHVAGAVAAGFGVLPVSEAAALVCFIMAALIAAGAVVGRYHYAVDCGLGAVTALLLSLTFDGP